MRRLRDAAFALLLSEQVLPRSMALSQVSLVVAGRGGRGRGDGRGVVGTRVAPHVAGDARVKHSCVGKRILRSRRRRRRRSWAGVTSRPFLLRQLFLFLTLPLWSHGYIYL